jgi:amino acid transporter
MNLILAVICVHIYLLGMLGARFYTGSKHESRVQRAGFCNFAAYIFGAGPILFIIFNMLMDMIKQRSLSLDVLTRMHFGAYVVMCIFAMALSSMIINDLKEEKAEEKNKTTKNLAILTLVATLVLLIAAVGATALPSYGRKAPSYITGFKAFESSMLPRKPALSATGPSSQFGRNYAQMFGMGRSR